MSKEQSLDNYDIFEEAEAVRARTWTNHITNPTFVYDFTHKTITPGSDPITPIPLSVHDNSNHLLEVTRGKEKHIILIRQALMDLRNPADPRLIVACNQENHPFTRELLGENRYISITLKNTSYKFWDEFD